MQKLDFSSESLSKDHIKEIEKHQGFNQDTIVDHYNELCINYDDIYNKVGWPDPKKCAEFVNELSESSTKDTVKILDLGCGTGLVGEYLNELGFKNIDGVDASEGMLRLAEVKKVYTNLDELFLGQPQTFPIKYHSQYDFTTASGVLADNHLDTSVFDEMLLSLKTGGICIFTTRIEYLTKYGYGPYMQELTQTGKWKEVKQASHFKNDK